jgi:pimeloyl-ACP methyl ester carboxylesterase
MEVFAEGLQHRYRLIAPDLRGYGSSRTDQPFEMTDHLQDLAALLDQIQMDQCLVLGWSLGGILAMELALRDPGRVRGLILVATAAHPVGDHPPITVWDQVYTGIASLLNLLFPGWPWAIETFGKRSLYRYLIQQHTPQTYRYIAACAVPAYLKTSAYARRALSQALRQGYNRLGDLESIQVPALVMAAAHDCHITPAASQKTAQALPQADWILYPDVAHLFPWEIPSQVQQDILAWIEQRDPR